MIVFFDGVCGLCNRAVDFLLTHDRHARLRFAPLQGETARVRLPETDLQSLSSLVIVDGDLILRKSDGFLYALSSLGGRWRALAFVLRLIPRFLRDFVYDTVAANRYAWFGKRDACRLPTPSERSRFLD
jgi:predicted DCC family thiol-disulfide oxidoreductase YuxK